MSTSSGALVLKVSAIHWDILVRLLCSLALPVKDEEPHVAVSFLWHYSFGNRRHHDCMAKYRTAVFR